MALFRKKTEAGILPEEVNQYYIEQRRERRGVMIVLSLLALVATLLIGLALFYGGRYIYHKMQNNKKDTTSGVVQTNDGSDTVVDGLNNFKDKNSGTSSSSTDQDSASTNPATNTDNAQASGSATTQNTTPAQTPALGDEPTTLPATGDEGH